MSPSISTAAMYLANSLVVYTFSTSPKPSVLIYYPLQSGGDNQRWQKRYFVLRGEVVQYYKLQSDVDHKKPRGAIDLTKGVGVRKRRHCHDDIVWPDAATEEGSFGVATEARTWYIYAESTSTAE